MRNTGTFAIHGGEDVSRTLVWISSGRTEAAQSTTPGWPLARLRISERTFVSSK